MKKKIVGMEWANEGLFVWRDNAALLETWNFSPLADPTSFAHQIKQFVRKYQLESAAVSLALPRSEFYVGLFPLSPEKMASNGSVGIPQERLAVFRKVLEEAGLNIEGIGMSSSAMALALSCRGFIEPAKTTAVLDVGPINAQILICRNHSLLFSRVFPATVATHEADKTIRYFCHQNNISPVPLVELKPHQGDLAAEGQALMLERTDGFWIVPPRKSRWREITLVVLSIVLVLGSFAGVHERNKVLRDRKILQEKQVTAQRMKSAAIDAVTPIFWTVAQAVPRGAFLVDLTYDANRQMLSIRGRASDYTAVSQFVSELSKSHLFRSAHGDHSALISIGNKQIVEFSVEAAVALLHQPSGPSPTSLSGGAEEMVSQAAKKSGVVRVLNLRTGQKGTALEVEWEGSPISTMEFVRLLQSGHEFGHCSLLQISSIENNRQIVRARAAFGFGPIPVLAEGGNIKSDKPSRNIFASLWPVVAVSEESDRMRFFKKEEESRKKEQVQMDLERKNQEEIQRIASKRKQLESDLVLTGIVNNGRETLAFVNNRAANGATVMLRNGDIIEEARVTGIEESPGRVHLDYDGKFQVSLRIN